MIIACPSCSAKYKYDETKLGASPSKKMKCPKCKGLIEVFNQRAVGNTRTKIKDSIELESTFPAGNKPPIPEKEDIHVDGPRSEGPRTSSVKRDSLSKTGGGNDGYLKLPEYRRLSLAVIQGFNSGEIFQINKPKIVIGRSEADVMVKDLEASRQHARLEIMNDRVVLRDLNSTNGTFVNEEKITQTNLENHSEFRIGGTVFMLIITDVE